MKNKFILFQINEFKLVLNVKQVLYIMDNVKINKIPFYPDYVLGLVKYNEIQIPLIDLLYLINGEKSKNNNLAIVVLINNKEHSFLVSNIEDIMTIEIEKNNKIINFNEELYTIINLKDLNF